MPAKAQTVAGKWTVKYPARVQNVNGQITADTAVALLTIEVRGDSIFGTWHAQNAPVPVEPRAITGTFKDGTLSFTGALVNAKIRRGGGDEESIQMRTFYEGKVSGDQITGTMYSESIDGTIHSSTMNWSGKRTS
jgi:hypothetical protein